MIVIRIMATIVTVISFSREANRFAKYIDSKMKYSFMIVRYNKEK